jgi:hypothetical protein
MMGDGKVIEVQFGARLSEAQLDEIEDMIAGASQDFIPNRVPISNHRGSPRDAVHRYTGGFKCSDCGEQITPSRLRAKPNATRCVDCQMDAESHGWSAKQCKNPRP